MREESGCNLVADGGLGRRARLQFNSETGLVTGHQLGTHMSTRQWFSAFVLLSISVWPGAGLIYLVSQYGLNYSKAVYALLLVSFLCLIGSMALPQRYRESVALLLLASTVPLLAGEAYLDAYRGFKITADGRTPLQVVEDMRQEGVNAYPYVSAQDIARNQNIMEEIGVYPISGISRVVTVFCNESGRYSIYSSDRYGFNNPDEVWDNNQFAVGMVGDSYANGACVSDSEDMGYFLRTYRPNSVSVGHTSNGPLNELASIREYLSEIKPAVVLWMYYEGNDLTDLTRELQIPALRKYLNADYHQGLIRRQAEIDEALQMVVESANKEPKPRYPNWIRVLRLESFRLLVSNALQRVKNGNELIQPEIEELDDEISQLQAILVNADQQVSSWSGQLVFVYLPTINRYNNLTPTYSDMFVREEVLTRVRMLDIPVIDMHDVFQSQERPLEFFPWRRMAHYNAKGYRLVTETVIAELDRLGIPY